MKKCAFLTTSNLEGFFVYDRMTIPYLSALGWEVSEVSWHESQVDWNSYDLVVVRSTWDYQSNVDDFLDCLSRINASTATLENSFETLRWNVSKTYLRELESKGIPTIPTLWHDTLEAPELSNAFVKLQCSEIVVKPYISANSDFTYRLSHQQAQQQSDRIIKEYQTKGAMIQPFLNSIVEEGEYSLFYFNGEFSHAISKHPKDNDFRVQEEHGGQLKALKASDAQRSLADQTLKALPDMPLYARIDIVNVQGKLCIIEVELIEPSLYFNMDEQSPKRFAHALHSKYG